MDGYEKEKEMVAVVDCRKCNYYTRKIRNAARSLLSIVERYKEFPILKKSTLHV